MNQEGDCERDEEEPEKYPAEDAGGAAGAGGGGLGDAEGIDEGGDEKEEGVQGDLLSGRAEVECIAGDTGASVSLRSRVNAA